MSKKISKTLKNNGYKNLKYLVCLDTNIVISMAGLHTNNKHEIETLHLNGMFDSVKAFKSAIDKRQITAIITPLAEIAKEDSRSSTEDLRMGPFKRMFIALLMRMSTLPNLANACAARLSMSS